MNLSLIKTYGCLFFFIVSLLLMVGSIALLIEISIENLRGEKSDIIPNVNFTILDTIICNSDSISFVNMSTDYDSISWLWDIGNDNLSSQFLHAYPESSTYIVLLRAFSPTFGDSLLKNHYENLYNKKLNNLEQQLNGNAAYVIPDSITVNQIARATLHIKNKNVNANQLVMSVAKSASLPNLKVDTSEVNIEEINIFANMTAALYCPFNSSIEESIVIRPIGDTLQLLTSENNYSALWQWDIIAKKSGKFPLNLKVQGKVDDRKGKSRSINMPVFTKNVTVVAEPNYARTALISLGVLASILGLFFFLFLKPKRTQNIDNHSLNAEQIKQVRDKIHDGNTKQAIEIILNKPEDLSSKLKNRLSTHLSELNDYNGKYGLGMIGIEEKNKAINRINHSVLETLGELEI